MPTLFWDASGLAKRYTVETGSDVADALFMAVPVSEMLTTVWGYAETFSILVRKLNDRRLDRPTFNTAFVALREEVIDSQDMGFLIVDESAILAGLSLMQTHNINSVDAALLATLLRYVNALPYPAQACILVAADQRLLRAANAQGVPTINPELMSVADVPTFLANL